MTSISKIALNNTEYNLEDTSARSSLDNLSTVATSGSYNDLSNKPDLSGYQTTTNLVTNVSSSSTDSQYPSAKCVYDLVGDIEAALYAINSGSVTMYDLTFIVSGNSSFFESLTVNNTTYTLSDFTVVSVDYTYSLTLPFASGTSITWSATPTSRITTNQGSLTLSEDTTINLYVADGKV